MTAMTLGEAQRVLEARMATEQQSSPASKPRSNEKKAKRNNAQAMLTMIGGRSESSGARVMQMIPQPMQLAVTRNLPHFNLPIGKHETVFTLKTCADSCAGVNLGDCEHHAAIAKLCPETVAVFENLSQVGRELTIGGVEQGGLGLRITHVIAHWMPFKCRGGQAKAAFGLTKNIAATALVGIGFLWIAKTQPD